MCPTPDDRMMQPAPQRPLDRIAAHARSVSVLCDFLEAIADDLPNVSPGACKEAARLASTEVPRHYEELKSVLIPLVRRSLPIGRELPDLLNLLEADISEGDAKLSETIAILQEFSQPTRVRPSADALGYALRSFFEAIRRQLSWEEEVLRPLAKRVLTKADLRDLEMQLALLPACSACPNMGTCSCTKSETMH